MFDIIGAIVVALLVAGLVFGSFMLCAWILQVVLAAFGYYLSIWICAGIWFLLASLLGGARTINMRS